MVEWQKIEDEPEPIEAEYDGWCAACDSLIEIGDPIVNSGDEWIHEECA